MNRRAKLLGHILRSSNDDPMRQVSFLPHSASRVGYGKKRVGKPRQNWLHHTKRFVYEQVLGYHNFDEHTDDNCVYAAAMSRSFKASSPDSLITPTPCIESVRTGRRRVRLGKIYHYSLKIYIYIYMHMYTWTRVYADCYRWRGIELGVVSHPIFSNKPTWLMMHCDLMQCNICTIYIYIRIIYTYIIMYTFIIILIIYILLYFLYLILYIYYYIYLHV